MAKIFDKILVEGVRKGQLPGRTKQAREWFRERAKRVFMLSKGSFLNQDKERLKTQPPATAIGSMYMYFYDPKTKNDLPYYDRFPLIFVIEMYSDGFLGINLHYLAPALRAKLMDGLYETINNQRYDEKTRLRINYNTLKAVSRLKMFEPCVKRYLYSHVRSKFMYIYPSEWDIALMLPTESFQKSNKQRVWNDSRNQIGTV